jgi:hypothetical protein
MVFLELIAESADTCFVTIMYSLLKSPPEADEKSGRISIEKPNATNMSVIPAKAVNEYPNN